MSDTSQSLLVRNYRRRLAERGLVRFEVLGRTADRELIRPLAKRLTEKSEEVDRLRLVVRRSLSGSPPRRGFWPGCANLPSSTPTSFPCARSNPVARLICEPISSRHQRLYRPAQRHVSAPAGPLVPPLENEPVENGPAEHPLDHLHVRTRLLCPLANRVCQPLVRAEALVQVRQLAVAGLCGTPVTRRLRAVSQSAPNSRPIAAHTAVRPPGQGERYGGRHKVRPVAHPPGCAAAGKPCARLSGEPATTAWSRRTRPTKTLDSVCRGSIQWNNGSRRHSVSMIDAVRNGLADASARFQTCCSCRGDIMRHIWLLGGIVCAAVSAGAG